MTTPQDFFAHPSAFIDPPFTIGAGTKIWHFSHVLAGAIVGKALYEGRFSVAEALAAVAG